MTVFTDHTQVGTHTERPAYRPHGCRHISLQVDSQRWSGEGFTPDLKAIFIWNHTKVTFC